jgi:hypothetical protein
VLSLETDCDQMGIGLPPVPSAVFLIAVSLVKFKHIQGMRNVMTVKEAKGVCMDRSKWKGVISAYPKGKRA